MRIPRTPPNVLKLVQDRPELFSDFGTERYQSVVRRCEEPYRHWEKVRFLAREQELDPEALWAMVKLGRMSRYRTLPLRGAGDDNLVFLVPDAAQRELMLVDRELAGRLAGSDEFAIDRSQRERFILSSLYEEAIASSMLEGAATTRRVAKQMLRSGRKPRSRGERMIVNNYNAIQFIREHRKTPLSSELLLELQLILTEGTLDEPDQSGRFRTESDGVVLEDQYGNVIHTPPPAHELPYRMKTLCEFANQDHTSSSGEPFLHPVLKACLLHFQIGYDHPFCDGNGRTARAVFYWSMLNSGYWLFEYLPISRLIYKSPARYTRAFLNTETDNFDATYFLLYHLRVIAHARRDLAKYLRRKQEEVAAARRLYTDDSSLNHRQREVILNAVRDPTRVFRIAEHEKQHAIAYATARADLLGLVGRGYMRQAKVGNRYEFRAAPRLEQE